ncbi:response regulator transcription factor [candidate division KSB1 bacterium]|nr:response regulator transcription factor [candidate division KSB1 bacterium]
MAEKTRVLIADDHPIFRQGLIKLLEAHEPSLIVGECGDGMETLQCIRDLKPDIAIVDISMPTMNGLEIIRCAKRENLPVEFIVLTMYKEEEYLNEALDHGIKGYLVKDNAVSDLITCLKAVARGECYVSPIVSNYLIRRKERIESLYVKNPELANLTATEKRILKLIADNMTSRQIAGALCISHRTVQNHRTHICEKLGLKGYNKLLQFALENKSCL